jgi:hypothetical protein
MFTRETDLADQRVFAGNSVTTIETRLSVRTWDYAPRGELLDRKERRFAIVFGHPQCPRAGGAAEFLR